LNLDVKREEIVEFGPLGYSRQEIVGRKQGSIHLVLIIHLDSPCGSSGTGLVHKPQGCFQNPTLKMTQKGLQWS
jgi:hypothetical protein